MKIRKNSSGFTVEYDCGIVTKTEVWDTAGILTFYLPDNKVSVSDISNVVELSVAYNSQFGISITEDGKYFFIQNWEAGLFCFDRHTGALIWHCNKKKAYNLVIQGTTAVCHFLYQCICTIEIASGNVISNYPMRSASVFLPFTDNYYLVGPKRGKYRILDGNLSELVAIPMNLLNPNSLENFIIREADFVADGISIHGYEYSDTSMQQAVKNSTIDELIGNSSFTRYVSISNLKQQIKI